MAPSSPTSEVLTAVDSEFADSAVTVSSPLERKPALIGLDLEALKALMKSMGEPAFRAAQLHHWLYVKCVRSFEEMTNLSKGFRQRLAQDFRIGQLTLADKQISQDGTVKYLFRLDDGRVVESVLIHFDEKGHYSICISSQVGCAVDCGFCATGKLGFTRNLTVGEIAEQYLFVQTDSGQEIRNIVFMGQGEPLLNYDNLIPAMHLLNGAAEVGMRRMTLSTAGIVPKIYKLAEEKLPITLAISLHAPDDETRDRFMPINKKWPVAEVVEALHHYVNTTHRRLTVEYILIHGLNDTPEHARKLAALLKGLKCNVNLIPYNPIGEVDYQRPSRGAALEFMNIILDSGKKCTVRLERGVDIDAACGQLANKAANPDLAQPVSNPLPDEDTLKAQYAANLHDPPVCC